MRSLAGLDLSGVEAHALHALHALEGVAYAGLCQAARASCERQPSTGTPSARAASIRPCSRETGPGVEALDGPSAKNSGEPSPQSALPRRRQPAPPHASCPAAELPASLKPGMFACPSSAVLFAHSAAGINLKRTRLSALRPPRAASADVRAQDAGTARSREHRKDLGTCDNSASEKKKCAGCSIAEQ